MPIRFNDVGEAQKVAANRKTTRPSFFDAATSHDQEISEDMEAALILIPAESRQQASQRIDAQTEQTDRVKKRDAILLAALTVDLENADAQVRELDTKVNDLQAFTAKFAAYASVSEIGTLLRDTQLGTDELIMAADRAKHRQVCATVLAQRIERSGISEALDNERKSWTRVLHEY